VKMRDRPPLLEEPCAQTLSGKNAQENETKLKLEYVRTRLSRLYSYLALSQFLGNPQAKGPAKKNGDWITFTAPAAAKTVNGPQKVIKRRL